ncbi:uncharacterized protein LOC144876362 [Branchiostoma floridae x Branchiostoma japonicum]
MMMARYTVIIACSRARTANVMFKDPWSCNGLLYHGTVGRQAVSTKVAAERNKERSFIMVKPNGVQRGLVGEVIKRFEQKGFKLVAMKFMQASEEHMQKHYTHLKSKGFYAGLCKYMSSSPVVPMVWEGLDMVRAGRVMLGETDPADSKPGSIRGDFCVHVGRTLANKERSFIMIKPDGVQRGLVGEVIKRFEQKGFKLVAMKFMQASEDHMKKHYIDLASKGFYAGLCKYMSSSPVVPMVWEGLGVVKTGRVMLGETNPADSKPGTIRGDFCVQIGRNLVHGSDSVESAKKEIALWFKDDEIPTYTAGQYDWVYED